MKRDATQTIWRTVVFAGAMLGAPACGSGSKKPANTTPTNTATQSSTTDGAGSAAPGTENAAPADPNASSGGGADPCEGGERPRGADDDGGGGVGRGFVLS